MNLQEQLDQALVNLESYKELYLEQIQISKDIREVYKEYKEYACEADKKLRQIQQILSQSSKNEDVT